MRTFWWKRSEIVDIIFKMHKNVKCWNRIWLFQICHFCSPIRLYYFCEQIARLMVIVWCFTLNGSIIIETSTKCLHSKSNIWNLLISQKFSSINCNNLHAMFNSTVSTVCVNSNDEVLYELNYIIDECLP